MHGKLATWTAELTCLAGVVLLAGCSAAHDEGAAARDAVGKGNLLIWRATGGHLIQPATIADPPKVDAEMHAEAMEQFNRAIELDSRYAEAYFARGVGQLYVDDYSAAIDDFTEAIRLDDRNAKAWYYRSLAHKATDQAEQAKDDLEQALSIDPAIAGAPAAEGAAATPGA